MFDHSPAATHPLVVTLQMDRESSARFTALRRAHFPPHRNWLDAHITLFYALSGDALARVMADVAAEAASLIPWKMFASRLLFLGTGVAYAVDSSEAIAMRSALASRWADLLGRQDRAWRGPLHITIQNKVTPAVAKALRAQLQSFAPIEIAAAGVDVWHYAGGPWEPAGTFSFGQTQHLNG